MNEETKDLKRGDLMAVTGQYEQDGKTKNRYHRVGVVFITPHGSNGFGELDCWPQGWDGKFKIFMKDNNSTGQDFARQKADEIKNRVQQKTEAEEAIIGSDDEDKVDLSDIPFLG